MEKNLGHATAYGYARSKGYSGTEEEFAELMADYASVGQSAAQSAEQAAASATSASGSAATASQAATTAETASESARTSATASAESASQASQSAESASESASASAGNANFAASKALDASNSASTATQAKTDAITAKTDAESARDAAAQSASEAAASAESIDPDEFNRKIYAAYVTDTASGSIASFPDGADSIPMKDVIVHIEPVQEGSGDPSLDNVRPITGWTGAKVTRTGKNLLPYPFSETTKTVAGITYTDLGDGKLKVNGTATGRAVFFYANHVFKPIPSGDYILSRNATVSNVVIAIDAYNGNTWVKNIKTSGLTENTFSIDYDGYDRLDIFVYISAGQTVSNDTISLMIRLATETDATFTPYTGYDTYDITFPTEAGTVYGGTLDVTKGELVVDRAVIASYAGETLPPTWISDRDVYSEGATPTTGAQVCYYLATPQTYQLTPQEITSLLGVNNLWADTGDSEVEYRADTKMYIDNKIAELQALVLENNGGN